MIDVSIQTVPYAVVGNDNITWIGTSSDLKQHYKKLKEYLHIGFVENVTAHL